MRTIAPNTMCAYASPSVEIRESAQRASHDSSLRHDRAASVPRMQRAPGEHEHEREHDRRADRPRDLDRPRCGRRAAVRAAARARADADRTMATCANTQHAAASQKMRVGRRNVGIMKRKCVGDCPMSGKTSGDDERSGCRAGRRGCIMDHGSAHHLALRRCAIAAPAPARPLERRRGAHRLTIGSGIFRSPAGIADKLPGPLPLMSRVDRRRHVRAVRRADAGRGRRRVPGRRAECTSSSAKAGGDCRRFCSAGPSSSSSAPPRSARSRTTFAEYLLRVLGLRPERGAVRDVRALRRRASRSR